MVSKKAIEWIKVAFLVIILILVAWGAWLIATSWEFFIMPYGLRVGVGMVLVATMLFSLWVVIFKGK